MDLTASQRSALVRVAGKMRRALRNGTGAQFTAEEMAAFALAGGLELAMRAELDELLAPLRASSAPD